MRDKQCVNPFVIGGAFVQYCVDHHILEVNLEGNEVTYYLATDGEQLLKDEFGIVLTSCAKIKEWESR